MGSRLFIPFLLGLVCHVAAQDCFVAKLADGDVTETVQIYSNEYSLEDDHVAYEIASSAPSNSFDQVSDPLRFLVNNQSACPSVCTVTLNRYTDTFQGNSSTVLFFDIEYSNYLPSHYIKDNKTVLICTMHNGSCGATVPVYRYYKITNGGVYHAYSFDQDTVYDGYNQEFMPICYAWTVPTGSIASRPACGTLNFDTPLSALSDLKIYDNSIDGIERDHFYTTMPSSDVSLIGYNQTGVLGKVLTSSKSTACSCLVKLQQQFDNQTGYFHRLDHKLVVTGMEPNRPYEEYHDTGETVYCAKRLGDCGATLPLWKHFQFYDIDTVYTTDSSPLPMSYLYPQTPLCYIWATNYAPNISNIPAAPPTPMVEIGSTMSTGASGTGSTPSGTGATTPSTIGASGSTGSTPSPSPSTSISPLSGGTIGTAGTTPSTVPTTAYTGTGGTMGTMGTTQSTISVWGKPGSTTGRNGTGGNFGTSGTTPSPGATPSTISVWGTSGTSTGNSGTSGTSGTGGTMETTPSTVSIWGTTGTTLAGGSGSATSGSTISISGTSGTGGTSGTTPSTGPGSGASASTVSVWGTTGTTPSPGATPSTVSVWGTSGTTTGSTGTTATFGTGGTLGTTLSPGATATISPTTPHPLSDGGITPGLIIPLNPLPTMPTTIHFEVTEANEPTESPMDGEEEPDIVETFTLSDFWRQTTTPTIGGSTGATSSGPTVAGAPPAMSSGGSSGATSSGATSSGATSEATTLTTAPPMIMITGPLFGPIIPVVTMAPMDSGATSGASGASTPFPPPSMTPSGAYGAVTPSATPFGASTPSPPPSGTLTPSATPLTTPFGASTPSLPPSGASTPSTPSSSPSGSLTPSPTTASPPIQHNVNSIVGGPLGEFTNPPIIQALIGSTASEPSPVKRDVADSSPVAPMGAPMGAPTVAPMGAPSVAPMATPSVAPSVALMGAPMTTPSDAPMATPMATPSPPPSATTESPGIIWKAGDWISSTWHSVFGGNDTPSVTPSTTPSTTSTPTPIGGLVGSWVNGTSQSPGSWVNGTKTWVNGAVNSTGEFFSNAWNSLSNNDNVSNGTTWVNGTKTWVNGAVNSTGEFFSNAWNSLSNNDENNGTSTWVNGTKTWVNGAMNSTGEFLSNAWNSLSNKDDNNGTSTWVNGAVNSTGEFLTNAWNSIGSNETETWVNGAMNSTGEFFSNAWDETKEHSGSFMNTSKTWISENLNGTKLIEGAKDLIGLKPSESAPEVSAPEVQKFNGDVISGPITG